MSNFAKPLCWPSQKNAFQSQMRPRSEAPHIGSSTRDDTAQFIQTSRQETAMDDNSKIDPSKKNTTVSSTELTDDQLSSVTGGGKNSSSAQPVNYMQFKLKEVLISGVLTHS